MAMQEQLAFLKALLDKLYAAFLRTAAEGEQRRQEEEDEVSSKARESGGRHTA
jgi:hypothetical protein